MVITSPFSSIRGFVATRPPLVLFTLCLVAFAVTTFTFAYYVEHRSDLPNIDAHRDWVSLLSFLSNQKLCLAQSETTTIASNFLHENETRDIISVSVVASLSLNLSYNNISFVQGYVSTEGWVSECPMAASVKQVKISYNVPHINSSVNNFGFIDVCVTITGPSHLLSPASEEKKCDGHLIHHGTWNIVNPTPKICSEGIVTFLKYQPSPHNAMLLTIHDRSIINLHLFHTSYFLLVMAITLICYAMIKGKPVVKHQPLDKIPIDA